MASIYQRKNKYDTKVWCAVIRIKGHFSVSNYFERKQEPQDRATQAERDIRLGQFKFNQYNNVHTFDELIDRFLQDGSIEYHRSQKDTLRHINYWKERFTNHIPQKILAGDNQ